MKVTKLRIDGQAFYLPPDTDIAALQEQLVTAASGAPAFVTFRSIGRSEIAVLMTPHMPVRFEIEEHPEDQVDRWAVTPPDIDIDSGPLFPSF